MSNSTRRFGTFEGVFTPTLLTILGVIMYLRLGWVVGNAGFGGALLIILLAKLVTVTTGLSLSSMATNVRIGAGGFYAFVSRSLGAEVGSAVGIPLYLSQALGAALYIIGFTEGWIAVSPSHDPRIVSTTALICLFILSFISAKVAMKFQYIIMLAVFLSLISFFMGKGDEGHEIVVWGDFNNAPFWVVFAIFFPAVTGIGAGAAMSGDLRDPRKSLPIGILSAIGISMIIYITVAYWLDRYATSEALLQNYAIMMDVSRWRMFLIAGIFGATLSSALGSIVGAPRTLMALGEDKVVPFAKILARRSKNGEPRYATLFTGIAIEVSLLFGELNTIAPLLTMFFLITYGAINLAVLVEKRIGIPSFRPSFNIPLMVPLVGGLWCLITMFLINQEFAAVAIVFILAVYGIQVKRRLTVRWGDVRSGLFNAIAEWAAKMSIRMPQHAKSWKPNLMIPVEDPRSWTHLMEFIKDIVSPSGTLRLFTVKVMEQGLEHRIHQMVSVVFRKDGTMKSMRDGQTADELEERLDELVMPVKAEGIFVAAMVIESRNFLEGISIITQVFKSMFFPPNIVFLTMSSDPSKDKRLEEMITISIRERLGIVTLALHPKAVFGKKEKVNIWLRLQSPNIDLALLMALQLECNWDSKLRVLSVADKEEDRDRAESTLRKIADRARMPAETEVLVFIGRFEEIIVKPPRADLNIVGISNDPDCENMHKIVKLMDTSCLFVKDSGEESIFA
ncbi:MAG: amino acid permease [Thermodesulfobacteriota bacterium]|nr:amino acid permease [Thermodesulfobacteriota bacterium]